MLKVRFTVIPLILAGALGLVSANPAWCVSVLPGWPKAMPGDVQSSPALGDLDGDGDLEVVVGCSDGSVYAWHHDATPVTGWPQSTGDAVQSSPALVDLDGDGDLEAIVGSDDWNVYAWHHDGTPVAGWPQSTGGAVHGSPATGDLDADGDLEVVVGSYDWNVYAWHHDGTPLAGWPQTTGGPVHASPAIGRLQVCPCAQVVAGSLDGYVYAWHSSGCAVAGWPQRTWGGVQSSPALGNLDGDSSGCCEVVVASSMGSVYAWRGDGRAMGDWPTGLGDVTTYSSPALGDLDGDGGLEVVIGADKEQIYAWDDDADIVAGWPYRTNAYVRNSPALADLDDDGRLEVVVASEFMEPTGQAARVHVVRADGTAMEGWPQELAGENPGSPALGDLDGDGDLEVVVGCSDAVYILSCDTWASDPLPWPMFRHDARRTGCHDLPATRLRQGSVSPGSGTTGADFAYTVVYANTSNSAPTEIWVGISIPGGTLPQWPQWYRMSEADPSDGDYTDGATYVHTTPLTAGEYTYRFAAKCGLADWVYWPKPAGSYQSGPTVNP